MAGTAPFTVARPAWDQTGSRSAVLDLREAALDRARPAPLPTALETALRRLGEHWWVGDYTSDAPNRHRDVADTAALVDQIQRDFARQPGVRVHWTGQDLLVEAGRWRTRPLACFTPLNSAYHPAATLLATLPSPPAYPARDAMDFDVPVSRAAVALLASARGDVARLLPEVAGPVSGTALLTAMQACFLSLPSARWHTLCDQARIWPGSLAELLDEVSRPQTMAGWLPTF